MFSLFVVVFFIFEHIETFSKSWAVIGMINGGMVLCTIVSPIEVARGPIKSKFSL